MISFKQFVEKCKCNIKEWGHSTPDGPLNLSHGGKPPVAFPDQSSGKVLIKGMKKRRKKKNDDKN